MWVIDWADRDFVDKLKLVKDDETIALVVETENVIPVKRGYMIRQFLLRPATLLRAGAEYRMPWPWKPSDGVERPFGVWQVSADEDRVSPALRRPTTVEYGFRADSCGGATRWATFEIDATEAVLAAVTPEAEGDATDPEQFLLPGGAVKLYSNRWCIGTFSFHTLTDRYAGTIRLMDIAGNWSEIEPFAFETTAEMRPIQRASSTLPRPRRAEDLFDDEAWDTAARFLADTSATRWSPRAFVPYDPALLGRSSFLGMPEEELRRLLGRGGEPSDLRPPTIVRYDYLMAPPPAGYHVWLKLGIDYDADMRLVVVSEEFAPCRYEDPQSPQKGRWWEMCHPYGLSSPHRDEVQVCDH